MTAQGKAPVGESSQITILGVGNILLSDEGVGVRVVERLSRQYRFPGNVQVLDGGVLGIRLMGIIGSSDVLIVVDAVKNGHPPGTLYRMADHEVPRRVMSKQSMHQMDLPEVLALCSAIDKNPSTIVVGVEPEDITTLNVALTPMIAAKVDDLIAMVLVELDRLGIQYSVQKPEGSGSGLDKDRQ
jgi:hydrogenase maturation protease